MTDPVTSSTSDAAVPPDVTVASDTAVSAEPTLYDLYWHTDLPSGRWSSTWSEHLVDLSRGRDHSNRFGEAW